MHRRAPTEQEPSWHASSPTHASCTTTVRVATASGLGWPPSDRRTLYVTVYTPGMARSMPQYLTPAEG